MPIQAMSGRNQLLLAIGIDRDDPFLGDRMASQASLGTGGQYDFSRSRRRPAPLSERFTLRTRQV